MKTQGHRNKIVTSELISTHCGFYPFFGLIHKLTWNKDWIANFCPIFSSFFKTKYFFQKLKALERDKVVFSFLLFFSPNVWVITLCYYLLAYQKELYKKRHIFFILLSLFLGFKNEISFHIFHILFFLLSIYPLAKWYVIHSFHLLNCDAIGWIFFIQLLLGRVRKIVY